MLSAIQTLGTYRFYKFSPEKWSARISGDSTTAKHWEQVFREHPEFFRFSSDDAKVSLVLRRQKPKLFDVDTLQMVTRAERDGRDTDGQARITRAPLEAGELQMLINVANGLHSKALQDRQDGRWWLPLVATVFSAVIGLAGVWLGATLKSAPQDLDQPSLEAGPTPTD
ncbi:N-carbamoyl-L-amino acid amidohydrolase [Salipiger sp. IMCC34102]|uniref:N-carbamoyl-L-amino acid amidohydrolase n=1 Tax=Salipiger sp. IMCC34102 TaxID=2510647 RepID=UPI00101D2CD6|nr:N-carbamoyl-L-amino acid amidohydrolase [Salipiger sp. IMCC34102]RYH00683.1 N-carbamoyl-L-amino acid amidohydrolase [Salipiger sp. IMCC34102]